MLKLTRGLFKLFSSKMNNNHTRFLSPEQLARAIKTEYFYVSKNHEEIGNHLVYEITQQRWNTVRKLLKVIKITELESWRTIRKISIALNNTINTIRLSQMTKIQIEDLLFAMTSFRFEPVSSTEDQSKHQYFNSKPFLQEVQDYITQLDKEQEIDHYLQIVRKLLHTNPELFENRKKEIEKYLIKKIPVLIYNQSLLNQILVRGCISNFWTSTFLLQVQQILNELPQFLNSIVFQDISKPTILQKQQKIKPNRTESEIKNIIDGFGYKYQANILINDYEVDFILGNKLIVQYNGSYHYATNTNKIVETVKDQWKKRVLRQRGFAISSIPYHQWGKLAYFEDKQKYLVKKIEEDWLAHHDLIHKNNII